MYAAKKAQSPRAMLVDVSDAEFALPLQQQMGPRIGGNITPASVNGILSEADTGRPHRLVDLTHEARQRDAHLQAILQVRELAIQSLEWDCVPPEGSLKRDKKIATFCKETLRAMRGWPELVAHLTGESTLFGHATAEIIWEKQGASLLPCYTKPVSCRRFAFEQTEGRLIFLPTPFAVEGLDLLAEFPGKFIQVRRRINGDVAVREGLCRALIWASLFRNWSTGDWMKLAEGFWKPWRTAKWNIPNPQPADVNGLKSVLMGMTASGVGVMPATADITVHWPQFPPSGSNGSPHAELLGYMAREMSKCVLGGTDTVEPGNKGALASAEVRNEVRNEIRDADALALAAEIKRHLLEPLVRMNFGESATVPEFFFITEDPEDVSAFSLSILNLRKAGLKIPSSYVYEKTGMAAPKDGDELLGDGAAVAPDNSATGADANANGDNKKPNAGSADGQKPPAKA